ncbi:MarR family winged helix-turn-helix transcriptional regulator [Streptomyces sp. NPDC048751]|uniref:MarR family winged helix-turn-helix transcriptional regulator n=1 Tax=Streptomyces sp. NPDC048751 TaxID=3365591 RepID=UPI0037149CAC
MTHLGGPRDDQVRDSGDGPEALALEIADAVERLTNLWTLAAQQGPLRLSQHQLRALRALESSPGLNLTGLAERLETGLPTASRLCDRLEAAGLLERALHPERRREVRLALTPHGRNVLDDIAERRSQALAMALARMGSAERAALRRGMRAYLAAQDGGTLPAAGSVDEE